MKKLLIALCSGALMLSTAGMAGAQPANPCIVNIYGASAQHTFWNAVIGPWFTDTVANSGAGCPPANVSGPYNDNSNKNAVAWATGCALPGCPDILVRYSSKNSCGGLQALACIGDPDGCGNPCFRKMADETSVVGGIVGATKCVDVTHGCADVEAKSLVQNSSGQKLGPLGGGAVSPGPCGVTANPAWSVHRSFIVPFGFFVNDAVTQSRCVGGTNAGEICSLPAHCPSGTCTAQPLVDMSRLMAVMIFSGQAWNWTDFGASFPNLRIEACLRHAGSGTHATLDFAVMRGTDWGWPLVTSERYNVGTRSNLYFNDGSSDMMKCVNGAGDGVHAPNFPSGTNTLGRVGYADADQSNQPFTYGPLKYNGYYPFRANIRNGLYDNFWSAQWCYDDCTGVNGCQTVDNALYTWAGNNVPTAKANFWTPLCEMRVNKVSDDKYPQRVNPTCPQVP